MYDNPLLSNQNNYMQGISASMNAPSQNSMSPQQGNNLQPLGELIRQQGGEEDTILAHINPLEAQMLKQMGGSGHINPVTGLPSFSIFTNPIKAITSSLGGGGGAILGNMLMPGLGGIVGGALGQGLQNTARGKSFGQGALKGGLMGAALPSAAGLAGMGANSLGMTGAGNYLTNYGAQNAILPSLGFGAQEMTSGLANPYGMAAGVSAGSAAMPEVALSSLTNNVAIPQAASLGGAGSLVANATAQAPTFLGKLAANTSDLLSNPLGIIAAATALGSLAGRPKAESPEKQASKEKRLTKARRLTAQERAEKEADELADRQMERRIARNQYLPEEMFTINPLYRHVNTPEQYRQTGRWMNYNNIPNYA